MAKKILFILPYPVDKAPSQRLKFEQYFDAIRESGIEIKTSSFISESFWKVVYTRGNLLSKIWYTFFGYLRRLKDLFQLRKYDLVYIHLWVTPFGFPIWEWLFCKVGKKIIYDIDDLIYLGTDIGKNKIIHGIKGRTKPLFLIRHADHNIVCTPKLEEFARKFSKNVTDISSTINTETYQPVNHYSNDEILTIGWSGSHSTSKYLQILKPVLLSLNEKRDFKLLVIGDQNFKMEGIEIEAVPWEEETEVPTLQRIDIGLYPLPDEDWVYGKSGLKALQYMALGIPTVATAIGANFRIIDNEANGILVNTNSEWLEALESLIDSPEKRRKLGTAGRETVVDLYSIKANTHIYLTVINDLLFEQ